jgi:hypothetical protein
MGAKTPAHMMHLPGGMLKPKLEKVRTVQAVLKKHGMDISTKSIQPVNIKHTVHRFEHEGQIYFLKEHPKGEGFADPNEIQDAINKGIAKTGKTLPNPTVGVIEHEGTKYVLQKETNVQMAKGEHKDVLAIIHDAIRENDIDPLDGGQVSEHGVPIDFDCFMKNISEEKARADTEELLAETKKRGTKTIKELMQEAQEKSND